MKALDLRWRIQRYVGPSMRRFWFGRQQDKNTDRIAPVQPISIEPWPWVVSMRRANRG